MSDDEICFSSMNDSYLWCHRKVTKFWSTNKKKGTFCCLYFFSSTIKCNNNVLFLVFKKFVCFKKYLGIRIFLHFTWWNGFWVLFHFFQRKISISLSHIRIIYIMQIVWDNSKARVRGDIHPFVERTVVSLVFLLLFIICWPHSLQCG